MCEIIVFVHMNMNISLLCTNRRSLPDQQAAIKLTLTAPQIPEQEILHVESPFVSLARRI